MMGVQGIVDLYVQIDRRPEPSTDESWSDHVSCCVVVITYIFKTTHGIDSPAVLSPAGFQSGAIR